VILKREKEKMDRSKIKEKEKSGSLKGCPKEVVSFYLQPGAVVPREGGCWGGKDWGETEHSKKLW